MNLKQTLEQALNVLKLETMAMTPLSVAQLEALRDLTGLDADVLTQGWVNPTNILLVNPKVVETMMIGFPKVKTIVELAVPDMGIRLCVAAYHNDPMVKAAIGDNAE